MRLRTGSGPGLDANSDSSATNPFETAFRPLDMLLVAPGAGVYTIVYWVATAQKTAHPIRDHRPVSGCNCESSVAMGWAVVLELGELHPHGSLFAQQKVLDRL